MRVWRKNGFGGSVSAPEPDPTPPTFGGEVDITYTLPESAVTSAAVYDLNDTLIRHLWDGTRQAADDYEYTWDGKDDDGSDVSSDLQPFTVRVAKHNIYGTYTNLFNTAEDDVDRGALYQFSQPACVVPSGTKLVWFGGYTEGTPVMRTSPLDDSDDLTVIHLGWEEKLNSSHGDCDGTYAYIVISRNPSSDEEPQGVWLAKIAVADGAEATWSGLTPDSYDYDDTGLPDNANFQGRLQPIGTNADTDDETYDVTGIAVQQTGSLIAIAQPNASRILIINKATGATVYTLSDVNPEKVAWSSDETELWVSDGTDDITVMSGDFGDVIGLATVSVDAAVYDLATDWAGGRVAACCANHVIHLYNDGTLAEDTTVGQIGGFSETALWQDDRFHFSPITGRNNHIAFDSSGRLWVYQWDLSLIHCFENVDAEPETGARHVHFAQKYHAGFNITNTNMLFASSYLRYTRDWTVANTGGSFNGTAWDLTHFYGYSYVDDDTPDSGGIRCCITLSARVFAYIRSFTSLGAEQRQFVELDDDGVRVISGITVPTANYGMDASGHHWYVQSNTLYKRTYSGLDGSNNPILSSAVAFAAWNSDSVDLVNPIPSTSIGNHPFPVLADGTVVLCNSELEDPVLEDRYHIGAIRSDWTWRWRHGRAQTEDVPYPDNGKTATEGNANIISGYDANGNFVVVSASGEFYYGSQSGAHLFYDKNGMYLFKLGIARFTGFGNTLYPHKGWSGNALRPCLFQANSKYRYLVPSEATLGIGEWTLENTGGYEVLSDTSVNFDDTVALGSFTDAGDEPQAFFSATLETDDFNRADSTTLGGGWSKLLSYNGTEIRGNRLCSINNGTHYANYEQNCVYDDTDRVSSWQEITIPQDAHFTSMWGHSGSPNFEADYGIAARINTTTGARIVCFARYQRRISGGTPGTWNYNGRWLIGFSMFDGTTWWDHGYTRAGWLPDSPGSEYKLIFGCVGTAPTRLIAILDDTTQNERVIAFDSRLWDTAMESTGRCGINFGMENMRVDDWKVYDYTWDGKIIPHRFA